MMIINQEKINVQTERAITSNVLQTQRSENIISWFNYWQYHRILLNQFYDSKKHIFGKGVYFTDMLDYEWNYSGRNNNRENYHFIPKIGDSFSIIAMKYL